MCGIVGYVGRRQALPFLLQGLERLKPRGYDSAGVTTVNGGLSTVKSAGKLENLRARLQEFPLTGTCGIGHTRWATHGEPNDTNAHPHLSCDGAIAVVHNGIIENAGELRKVLEQEGHGFVSETDSEVLAHLIERFLRDPKVSLAIAVQQTAEAVTGAFAIAVVSRDYPDQLIGAMRGSPLVVGLSADGWHLASAAEGVRDFTDQALFLNNDEMVILRPGEPPDHQALALTGGAIQRSVETLRLTVEELSLGGFEHFMIKEIMEQPERLRITLAGRLQPDADSLVKLGGFARELANGRTVAEHVSGIREVFLTACGTSYHAALIGRRVIQKLTGLPTYVELASEFVTSPATVNRQTLVIVLSQSGSTKDTLAAVQKAKGAGAVVWGICNVVQSELTRLCDSGVYLHVGPEIGVASTKAFSGQVVALVLTALAMVEARAKSKRVVSEETLRSIAQDLAALPDHMATVLERTTDLDEIVVLLASFHHALYLGRGYNLATALEGALKLKEISGIHAEGMPAGEMKHGPIALIDADMPVVIIAPLDNEDELTYARIMSNLEEVRSRGGQVILIASDGDEHARQLRASGKVRFLLTIPHSRAMFTPVLASLYCHQLAYKAAVARGLNPDQPRNLAKSVTVE